MTNSMDAFDTVGTAKAILTKQSYKPFESDYSNYLAGTFVNSEVFHGNLHPKAEIRSLGNFVQETTEGLHLVTILIDSTKPGKPFMVEMTTSDRDAKMGALRLSPLPTTPLHEFVSHFQKAPATTVIDYFDGRRRQALGGNAAPGALKLELEG